MMHSEAQRQRFFKGIVPRRRSSRQINPNAAAARQSGAESKYLDGVTHSRQGLTEQGNPLTVPRLKPPPS